MTKHDRFIKQQIKEFTEKWLAVDADRASYFDPVMFEYAFLSGMMAQLDFELTDMGTRRIKRSVPYSGGRIERTEPVHDKGIVSDLRSQYPIKEEK